MINSNKLKILQFFQEDNGVLSAIRLAFISWTFGLLIVWMNSSIQHKRVDEVPASVVALITVFMTGKVSQKIVEQNIPISNEVTLTQTTMPNKVETSKEVTVNKE